MSSDNLTVWQQLGSSGSKDFSFEDALLAVIKQCEYERSG